MENKLKTVDAETLLSTPLPRTHFVVDELIPQGIHILCGASKIGKSWLMLWLCLQVAEGKPIWNFPSKQSDVLYLCLEDTFTRIQERLYTITDSAPENLRFAVMCGKIGQGLEKQIENFILEFKNTRLIVIDTLQKVRGENTDKNAYGNDYNEISLLKTIADKYGIAIVLVHHLRKLGDASDPFNQVSGTTGITGAVDSSFVLKKDKRSSQTATLLCTGRDIEYQELTLRFEDTVWELVGIQRTEEIRKSEIPAFVFRVVSFINERKDWRGNATDLLTEIADVETRPNAVTKYLSRYCYEVLADNNISYSTRRTGKCREIHLKRDNNDANDSKNAI